MDYGIEAFMDNDESKWNKTIEDVSILNPREVDNRSRETRYIVANNLHSQVIKAQLMQYGVEEGHICIF